MSTPEEFVAALNQAGVAPEQLAGLLQIAGVQAEIEALKGEESLLQAGREMAILKAAAEYDVRLGTVQELIRSKIGELELLRTGGKRERHDG